MSGAGIERARRAYGPKTRRAPSLGIQMEGSSQRSTSNPTRMAANPASRLYLWSFVAHSAWIRVNHPNQLLISCVNPGARALERARAPLQTAGRDGSSDSRRIQHRSSKHPGMRREQLLEMEGAKFKCLAGVSPATFEQMRQVAASSEPVPTHPKTGGKRGPRPALNLEDRLLMHARSFPHRAAACASG